MMIDSFLNQMNQLILEEPTFIIIFVVYIETHDLRI